MSHFFYFGFSKIFALILVPLFPIIRFLVPAITYILKCLYESKFSMIGTKNKKRKGRKRNQN